MRAASLDVPATHERLRAKHVSAVWRRAAEVAAVGLARPKGSAFARSPGSSQI